MPMQHTENILVVRIKIFTRKKKIYIYIFLIFAKNIDCGYMLEPPPTRFSKNYYSFYSYTGQTFLLKGNFS